MENIVSTLIYILFFLSTALSYYLTRKRLGKNKRTACLPPGTMGWPFTGETLQLYSQAPDVFFLQKQKRLLLLFTITTKYNHLYEKCI